MLENGSDYKKTSVRRYDTIALGLLKKSRGTYVNYAIISILSWIVQPTDTGLETSVEFTPSFDGIRVVPRLISAAYKFISPLALTQTWRNCIVRVM